ncbi:MAG: flagellin FliC [Oligoflexia bacterium]|nr:flagellin FliC [Oligoflexia bacterium]
MGFRVTTNIASVNAQRNLTNSQYQIQDSYAKLSSGSRINKAADDAAGLAISEQLKASVRSSRQANRNANDGISMVQTAEGGLNEISNIITRLRELGIQAASDTVGDRERGMLNEEVLELKEEMQRIALTTKWGETNLLDGTSPNFDFQVGVYNNEFEDRITFAAGENSATIDALGLDGIDYASKEGAQEALALLDEAHTRVNGTRANLGALQNRLLSTVQNLSIQEENMSAANSRIRDTDVAYAAAENARNQVLLQAGVSTLAQANQTPALALKLIG